jgi:hypothetical protein
MKNRLILILVSLFLNGIIYAQALFLNEQVSGKQYQVTKMTDFTGSQFLFDDWKPAVVIIEKTGIFKDVPLLFDIHNKLLYFKKEGNTFLFNNPVTQFEFLAEGNNPGSNMVFRNFTINNGKKSIQQYVQVLTDGKYHLLKTFDKAVDEVYEYNNPVKLKVFRDVYTYTVFSNNESHFIEFIAKDAQAVLTKINPSIFGYIKQNGKLKTEEDLIKAVKFLNEQ